MNNTDAARTVALTAASVFRSGTLLSAIVSGRLSPARRVPMVFLTKYSEPILVLGDGLR